MGTIIAAVIVAVVGAATAIGSSVANSNAVDDANKMSEKLYQQQRADEEKWKEEQAKLARLDRRQRRKEFKFTKEQTAKATAERKEVRGHERRQQQFKDALGIANATQQGRDKFFDMWNRKRAA